MESSIPSLMQAADRGDASAAEALFAALYSELHRLARRELARHGGAVSLSVTTLLHEAYLDIAGRDSSKLAFPDRPRFVRYASRVMRGLIIDHARQRRAQKRGGQFEITSLEADAAQNVPRPDELMRISDAPIFSPMIRNCSSASSDIPASGDRNTVARLNSSRGLAITRNRCVRSFTSRDS